MLGKGLLKITRFEIWSIEKKQPVEKRPVRICSMKIPSFNEIGIRKCSSGENCLRDDWKKAEDVISDTSIEL